MLHYLSLELGWHLSGMSPRLRAAEQMEGSHGPGGRLWRRRRFICKALSALTNGDTHYFYVADDRRIPFMVRNSLASIHIVQLSNDVTFDVQSLTEHMHAYEQR